MGNYFTWNRDEMDHYGERPNGKKYECQVFVVLDNTIFDAYRRLAQTESGALYKARYDALKAYVQGHQDELYRLVFSNQLTDAECADLVMFGREDGGSCSVSDSPDWQAFFARVYARLSELPPQTRAQMQWYHTAHGWGASY